LRSAAISTRFPEFNPHLILPHNPESDLVKQQFIYRKSFKETYLIMHNYLKTGVITLMAVMAVGAILVAPATNHAILAQDDTMGCTLPDGDSVEISDAKLYIEYQATDGDMGVHGLFDDHGWSELCVFDPNGQLVLHVNPQSALGDLTMAGIFFESREPLLEEYSYEDLMANFPEGEYTVVGTNHDGTGLTGAALFSHSVPNPPVIVSPVVVEEDMADEAVVSVDGLVVEWEDVTETIMGDPVTITGYEIIITNVDSEDPHGMSRPIFDVHVAADRNSLSVPVEFLEPGTLYEIEVLALEESGNQTISVGFFTTE
jgi:hypothetical protein